MNENNRFELLEKRVAQLEKEMASLTGDSPKERFVQESRMPEKTSPPDLPADHNKPKQPVLQAPGSQPRNPVDWEHVIGQVWLPRVFIFVLLLGVLWGFNAAIDYGILTEPIRCFLGLLLAGTGIWVGQTQMAQNRTALGQVLLGGSVVVLLLTTFSAHLLFGLIPPLFAFVANLAWIALGIYFSRLYQSEALALLAASGGVLAPFLTNSSAAYFNPSESWFLVSYLTLFFGSLLFYSFHMKFKYLYYTSFLFLPAALLIHSWSMDSSAYAISAGLLTQHFLLLILFLKQKLYFRSQLTTLLTSFFFTITMLSDTFNQSFLFLSFAFTFLYGILSFFLRENQVDKLSVTLSIAFFSSVFFVTECFINQDAEAILLTLEGIGALYLGLRLRRKTTMISGAFIYILGLIYSFSSNIPHLFSLSTLTWLVAVSSLFMLFRLLFRRHLDDSCFSLSAGLIAAYFFIYEAFIGIQADFLAFLLGFYILYHFIWLKKLPVHFTGIALYVFGSVAVTENVIPQVASLESLSWIYVIASLVYLGHLAKQSLYPHARTLYLSLNSLAVFLGLIFLTIETYILTENLSPDSQHLLVSVAWAGYAVAGMIFGTRKNKKGARLAGVILLFVTLLKVITIDLPAVSIFIRAVLFIGLGVIGIFISRMFYKKQPPSV